MASSAVQPASARITTARCSVPTLHLRARHCSVTNTQIDNCPGKQVTVTDTSDKEKTAGITHSADVIDGGTDKVLQPLHTLR